MAGTARTSGTPKRLSRHPEIAGRIEAGEMTIPQAKWEIKRWKVQAITTETPF